MLLRGQSTDSVKVNNQRSENPDKQKPTHNLKLDIVIPSTLYCVDMLYIMLHHFDGMNLLIKHELITFSG